jgi:hypothetical protein
MARRVSSRSPHEYDVFIIPARRDSSSDDYGGDVRIRRNEGFKQRGFIMLQPIPSRFAVNL